LDVTVLKSLLIILGLFGVLVVILRFYTTFG
jgi:hypothetical protein